MPKKHKLWKVPEIVHIYFPHGHSVLLDDILLIILQFSGMVGDHYFWVYF